MMQNQYECVNWKSLPEGIMRPGGLELTDRLIALSGLSGGARILDAGCGRGASVSHLLEKGFDAVGVDISPELVALGKRRNCSAPLICADFTALPFADAEFDAVLSECCLSESDAPRLLFECRRVLKKGGRLLISDVYNRKDGLTRLYETDGFEVRHAKDCTQAIGDFAAAVIWQYGSLDALPDCTKWRRSATYELGYFIAVLEVLK